MRRNGVSLLSPGLRVEKVGVARLVRLLGLPPAVRFRHTPAELLYESENFTLRVVDGRMEMFSDKMGAAALAGSAVKVVEQVGGEVKGVVLTESVFVGGEPARRKVNTLVRKPEFLPCEPANVTVGYNAKREDGAVVTVQATAAEGGVQVELTVQAESLETARSVFSDLKTALQREGLWER